jgi:AcrR family transcriptional regulator
MSYRRTESVITRLEDNRTRILRAARELVAEGGWRMAHVATIAQMAGLATGTVYRYFPSKADLYTQVLSQVSSRERDIVASIVDSEGPAPDRLKGAVQVFASRALRGRRLAYALIGEPCDPEIDQARLVWRTALSNEFVRLIDGGQRAGAFRKCDPRIAGACVVGAFMEALLGPLAPEAVGDTEAAERLIAEISENCLALIAAEPEPRQPRLRRIE